ncbi:MAG: FecR family protein [Fermentimonas sp.]|jgi:transmembrane sensor
MAPNYSRYTDFLKDRQFVRWQLLPDEQLDDYWYGFMTNHPEHVEDIQKAIRFLKSKGLNKGQLTIAEQEALLESIQTSFCQGKKAKQRKLFRYVSVASAAVAVIAVAISLLTPPPKEGITPGKELIVGELLNSEDIQLVTSHETISFQNDIDVILDGGEVAEITEKNNEVSKVSIAPDQLNSLVVPYGKRSSLTLSDGSKVWLNSGSVLEFPAQFRGNKREIHLMSGEMYVEVAPDKNKPFHVQTEDFNVKAYGTKFNVSSYANSPRSVVLVEGSVSLQSAGEQETFLSPSEQAVYSDDGTFTTRKVDVNQVISWKNGYLEFNKTPMNEVLQQIGRYYNLSFDFDNDVNLQKRTCTGKIYLSENLDYVMTTIALLTSTKYMKDNDQVFIINELFR